jgi:hypothetical protein
MKISIKKREFNRIYYLKNKEKFSARSKEYYKVKEKEIRERRKAAYWKNRDNLDFKIKQRESSRKTYLKYRDRKLKQGRERWEKYRKELLQIIGGGICVKCGFSDWRALQIDHIGGGGRKELENNKLTRSPLTYKKLILSNKNNYQVLCANCNWIKRYEKMECKGTHQI